MSDRMTTHNVKNLDHIWYSIQPHDGWAAEALISGSVLSWGTATSPFVQSHLWRFIVVRGVLGSRVSLLSDAMRILSRRTHAPVVSSQG